MDGQAPSHGVGVPGPVSGSHARSRAGRPEEAGRRHDLAGAELRQFRSGQRGPQGIREHSAADRECDHRQTAADAPGTPAVSEPGPISESGALSGPAAVETDAGSCTGRRSAGPLPSQKPPGRTPPSTMANPHDARGHRGHQGAADGSPDRAALAADQGARRPSSSCSCAASSSPSRSTTCWSGRSCWVAGPENSKFIYTALLEYFITQLKLAMFGAAFISFPVVATQIYMFVAPGLYRNERQAFLPYLDRHADLLRCSARSVVYFLVMPMLVRFSLGMQQTRRRRPGRDRAVCRRSANISR